MKLPTVLICTFSALVLTACDIINGTSRTVTVARLPDAPLVVRALKSVPGVQQVKQREVPPRSSWMLPEGIIHDPAFQQFTFSTATTGGTVETREDFKGIRTVHVYSFWMNHTPPKAEFDETRSLLDAAYLSLRRADPTLPPTGEVEETLKGYPSK
ncbi:hypothetical protein [Haloferula sp. BvORR071]|uniref:hypothetical protein n=1 Tax=Haloferula sp. BvORR071 TaxID=1396141 RepID=UPI0005530975|nr:hypothetical protein [Haloferula sp. BvORR071]